MKRRFYVFENMEISIFSNLFIAPKIDAVSYPETAGVDYLDLAVDALVDDHENVPPYSACS